MNKYHEILNKIIVQEKCQDNKKGSITYLLNPALELKSIDLLELFEGHVMALKKLKDVMDGERSMEAYRDVGVT